MPSWDVVNGAPLQWKLAEGGLSLLVHIRELGTKLSVVISVVVITLYK